LHNQTKGTRKCHDSGDTKYKAQVEISMIVINYGDDPKGLLNPIYFLNPTVLLEVLKLCLVIRSMHPPYDLNPTPLH
jgi:hypothetical protein